jgi:hypothetical protein
MSQLTLAFYEKRRRQVSWFGKPDDRHNWEQWCINVSILQPDVVSYEHSSLTTSNGELPCCCHAMQPAGQCNAPGIKSSLTALGRLLTAILVFPHPYAFAL